MATSVLIYITYCSVNTALVNVLVANITYPIRVTLTLARDTVTCLVGVSNVGHIAVANTSAVDSKRVVIAH